MREALANFAQSAYVGAMYRREHEWAAEQGLDAKAHAAAAAAEEAARKRRRSSRMQRLGGFLSVLSPKSMARRLRGATAKSPEPGAARRKTFDRLSVLTPKSMARRLVATKARSKGHLSAR